MARPRKKIQKPEPIGRDGCQLDNLVSLREFPTIDRKMPIRAGMDILAHRLGLTGSKISDMLKDRYPADYVFRYLGLAKFNIRCFLRFDLIFSDILHVGHSELKHIGLGRKFLISRILRSVLSGMCDAYDPSGVAGDFRPYSWMEKEKSEKIKGIQRRCLSAIKSKDSKLLHSVKMRLRLISTDVLLTFVKNESLIRKEIAMSERVSADSGLRRFSVCLHDAQKAFADNKKRIFRKRLEGWKRMRKKYYHRVYDRTKRNDLFRACMYDLGNLLNKNEIYWFRRPTDEDWFEGQRSYRRKPRAFARRKKLYKLGMTGIPGITEPVTTDQWGNLRTDMKLQYVKNRYALEQRRLRLNSQGRTESKSDDSFPSA